jgi:PIN domain nuclease of toxin-antitoxin system
MIVSVADTHTLIWYLFDDPRLSAAARQVIEKTVQDGNQVGVSSISIAEMVYLSEKNRNRNLHSRMRSKPLQIPRAFSSNSP